MEDRIERIKNIIQQNIGKFDAIQKQHISLQKELENMDIEKCNIEEAQKFLQTVAKDVQSRLSFHIGSFITNALQAIWGEDAYSFVLNFIEKRNKTEVEMLLKTNDGIVSLDNLNNIRSGGGVLDIVAFGLRIALWSLKKPHQHIMILDQPFANLDNEHLPLAGDLIKELSQQLQMQFIIINHNPNLSHIADKNFIVEKKEGYSLCI